MSEPVHTSQPVVPSSSLPVGAVLQDRYRIQALLADRMGRVYEALDMKSDTVVILKEARASAEEFARLVAERETLIRLNHPGVMRALDFFTEDEAGYLVLERVEGISLLDHLESHPGPVAEELLVDWGVQLAEILCYLHSQAPPLIYRDLKPEHALLREDGRLLLIDFGIARVKKGGPRDTTWLGTPGYAAPEQYGIGTGESDERTDIYGLGATLFHLATRCLVGEVSPPASRDGKSRPPDVREFVPRYSESFSAVVRKALSQDPDERYPSAEALLRGLRISRPGVGSGHARTLGSVAGLVGLGAVAGFTGWSCVLARESGTLAPQVAAWTALGMMGGGLLAGAWGRFRRLSWCSVPAVGLVAMGAAVLLAGLDSAALATVAAHLRRFALNELPPRLHSPLVVWTLVGAWAGSVLWSGVEAVRRRRLLPALLLLALLLVGIVPGMHSEGVSRAQDLQVAPHVVFNWKSLWRLDVPAFERIRVGWQNLPLRSGRPTLLVFGMDSHLRGVDRETGGLLWDQSTPRQRILGDMSGHLLVAQDRRLVAWRLEDGKEAWSVTFDGEPRGATMAGADLVVSVGKEWRVLDLKTGRELWRREETGGVRGEWQGKILVVDDEHARLGFVDASTRKDVWSVDTGLPGGMHSIEPEAGVVIWATQREILGLDLATGAVRYRVTGPRPGPSAPLSRPWMQRLAGTSIRVVAAGSRVIAFDAATGQVAWTIPCGMETLGGLLVDQEKLVVETDAGRLLCFDPISGVQSWERWKRDAARGPQVVGRESRPFFTTPSYCVYQDPRTLDIMILESVQGTLVARVPVEGRFFLKALDFVENRLFLGLDGETGQGRVECLQVPSLDGGRQP